MVGSARRELEILVHTAAPSRGQDDARYRVLAQAYLDFEPAEVIKLYNEQEKTSEEDVDIQASSQLQEELVQASLEERDSQASYRPDDEPNPEVVPLSSVSQQKMDLRLELSQGILSPDLSFHSAVDNAGSPAWRGVKVSHQMAAIAARREHQQHSQTSFVEFPTEIADSLPDQNKAIPTFSSPTRLLELYLQQIQSSDERLSASYGIERDGEKSGSSFQLAYGAISHRSQSSQGRTEDPFSTSDLPSSPSLQKKLQKYSQRALKPRSDNSPLTQDLAPLSKRNWPGLSLDDGWITSSAVKRHNIETSTVTTKPIRSRKRQRTDSDFDEITSTKEVTLSKATVATVATTSSDPSFEAKSSWAEKSEIHPATPNTSVMDLTPEMLVTSSLQQLAQKMPLKTLFRPKEQKRDLRPMERGYWLLNCGRWDPGVRKRCWECLGNFIGRGMGGWGVWCIRDEELDTIKLYCWGTIVGHAYLLLYMASESKIKGSGACWRGGDGGAIITMPS